MQTIGPVQITIPRCYYIYLYWANKWAGIFIILHYSFLISLKYQSLTLFAKNIKTKQKKNSFFTAASMFFNFIRNLNIFWGNYILWEHLLQVHENQICHECTVKFNMSKSILYQKAKPFYWFEKVFIINKMLQLFW